MEFKVPNQAGRICFGGTHDVETWAMRICMDLTRDYKMHNAKARKHSEHH